MGGYYLIGEHLRHSFSAEIHARFGRYAYELKELAPAELGPFLEGRSFDGLNVTLPYKEAVIPYLDRLDGTAAAAGAVNTVVNRNGVLWGYNTDLGGMIAALRRAGIDPAGREVLILGTGGTSKTALAACASLGAAEAVRVSRTGREGALTYAEARSLRRGAEILINCTPAGMYPDVEGLPLDPADFPRLSGLFDCVYNPLRTRLVQAALSRGIPADAGLFMLVTQAVLACALFTGAPVEEEMADEIYKDLRRARENLVLIGMPGAGKTTVGRLLAQKLNREFVDTDEEIVKRAGKPIPVLFAEDGEDRFRDLETAVVRDLSASGGRVIAAGGGTVLREENVTLLRLNGRLFFLDRQPEDLEPSPDRPLGDTARKLERLYHSRYFRYSAAADRKIPVSGGPEDTAAAILHAWKG